MLARNNTIVALIELAIFALAWMLVLGPWTPAVTVLVLALASYVALNLLITLVTFAIAYRYRSPAPPGGSVGLAAGVWLVAKETAAVLAVYSWLIPLEALFRPAVPDRKGKGDVAVLLLHGFLCNGGVWMALRRVLARRGIGHVYTLNTEPPLGSITGFAQQASARIDTICAATGCTKVIIVSHSMGGLVARRMLDLDLQRDRVIGLITIGTPHHGTVHARLLTGAGATQMRSDAGVRREVPGNSWLHRLNAAENAPTPVPVLAIYSYQDNIVAPQASARLATAENLGLRGVGHLEMLFSKKVTGPVCERVAFWRNAASGR